MKTSGIIIPQEAAESKAAIDYTRFLDQFASRKLDAIGTLDDIEALIGATTKRDKSKLPFLKLARFGDTPSENNCLRYDANVLEITGVEGDHDSGTMTPEEARDRLAEAGVEALIATTPSHMKPGKGSRWRVLCPTSKPLPPQERSCLAARINGALGGTLAGESFTLSQAFYFGSVAGDPPVQTFRSEGRPIDLCHHLDAAAIFKSGRETPAGGSTTGASRLDVEAACKAIRTGDSYHPSIVALAGHYSRSGETEGQIVSCLTILMHEVPKGDRDGRWKDRLHSIPGIARDVMRYRAEDGDARQPVDPQEAFEDLTVDETDAKMARILDMTVAEMLSRFRPKEDFRGLTLTSPAECERFLRSDYVVKSLIARGQVGCIFGEPGAGKSIIAPNLAYAVAQGRDTFGLRTKKGTALYVAAEDETGMRKRFLALRAQHGDTDALLLVGGVSDLITKDSRHLDGLLRAVRHHKPALIVIDTLAMAFPGIDENTSEAMGRVVAVGRQLAAHGAAVIFVHHSPKAGDTPRGHSLFNGALDVALHLLPTQDGIIRGRLTKNRNGPCTLDIAFKIGVHEIGLDEDGDPITAPFAEELAAVPAGKRRIKRLTGSQNALLAIIREHVQRGEAESEAVLLEAASGMLPSTSGKPESRRRHARRVLDQLEALGEIVVSGGLISLRCRAAEDFEDISDAEEAA
jgi:hypothetical protein